MAQLGSRAPTEDEFADFVRATWPALYRTAVLLCGDHGRAEDLAQGALAATYDRWARLRDPQAAHGYARRCLVNAHASWFRRRSNRLERPTRPEHLPETTGVLEPDHGAAVGDRLDVLAALAALAPRQRAVVVLRYYDDLSVAETADALGVTAGTVKSQTSVALAALRRLLDDQDLLADTTPGGHRG